MHVIDNGSSFCGCNFHKAHKESINTSWSPFHIHRAIIGRKGEREAMKYLSKLWFASGHLCRRGVQVQDQ